MDNISNFNDVLKAFKISAECINFLNVKNACFYDLELKPGTRISKLKNYAAEIALALKTSTPRFEVLPEQGIVRCEFLKKRNNTISLFKLGNSVIRPKGKITCLLGETLIGDPLWIDITATPHILVAGTTGSGKSTLLHNIIANTLLYPNIEVFLIDPKNSEFFKYKSLPKVNVSFTYKESLSVLEHLLLKMEERYSLIRTGKSQNIPYTILIIDEFADLCLQDTNNQIFNLFCRLIQKSRAARIHIVCATQRPSVDVINGTIKANFPTRIACKVVSSTDSKVILNSPGAENLIGLGDAIINNSDHNMVRFQTAYVSQNQIIKSFGKCNR